MKNFIRFFLGMLFMMAFVGSGGLLMLLPLACGMSDYKIIWWQAVVYIIVFISWMYMAHKIPPQRITDWIDGKPKQVNQE